VYLCWGYHKQSKWYLTQMGVKPEQAEIPQSVVLAGSVLGVFSCWGQMCGIAHYPGSSSLESVCGVEVVSEWVW
jgi:hypothetical protein